FDYGVASENIPESRLLAGFNNFTAATLPDDIAGWQKSTSKTAFTVRDSKDLMDLHGAHSRAWMYQRGNLRIQLSMDYPFAYWHDLRICYTTNGWTVENYALFNHTLADGKGDLECMTARLVRPVERNAYLWFGEFDLNGNPIEAKEPAMTSYRFIDRFDSIKNRWGRLLGRASDPETRAFQILQVQAVTEMVGVLSEAENRDFQKFFTSAAELVRGKCLEVLKAAAAQTK